jgi:hypothetical protein
MIVGDIRFGFGVTGLNYFRLELPYILKVRDKASDTATPDEGSIANSQVPVRDLRVRV